MSDPTDDFANAVLSEQNATPRLTRRGLLRAAGRGVLGLGALSLGGGAWAHEVETSWLEITRHEIVLPHLAREFDGFTVAHLSDLHVECAAMQKHFAEVARRTTALRPDLIVVTGDFVSKDGSDVENWLGAGLRELQAPFGVLGVLGNHDCFVPGRADWVRDVLLQNGARVLRNEIHRIERNGQTLLVGGLDDWILGAPDLSGLSSRVPDKSAAVLLMHEPDFFWPNVAQTGKWGLTLAGHTHGGQIALPFHGPLLLPAYGQNFARGRFEREGATLYVNRGLGTVGLPFRLCARPEIALLTLSHGAVA